jgi:hypothetical protein
MEPINFEVSIVREDDAYWVWLASGRGDPRGELSEFSFVVGAYASFDAAVVACIEAFPGRPILTYGLEAVA